MATGSPVRKQRKTMQTTTILHARSQHHEWQGSGSLSLKTLYPEDYFQITNSLTSTIF